MPFLLIYVTHPSKPEAIRITTDFLKVGTIHMKISPLRVRNDSFQGNESGWFE